MPDLPDSPEHLSGPDPFVLMGDLCSRLEAMFDDSGLTHLRTRDPAHRAVARFDALQQLIREGGHLLPGHVETAIEALREWLDTITWAPENPGGEFWGFLADEAIRTRTVSVLFDPEQFDDAMAELFYCGWLVDHGFEARRVEEDGVSDIVVNCGGQDEVRAEVKRIHRGTDARGVAGAIKKANRQIKKSAPLGGGIAFISLDLEIRQALPGDEVPPDVQLYIDEATRATRLLHSSVGQVVVTWEDVITHGDWPGAIGLFVRRRSVVVDHAAPLVAPAIASEDLEVGMTASMRLDCSPSQHINQSPADLLQSLRDVTMPEERLGSHPVMVSAHLKGGSGGPIFLRKEHAERAFRKPDAVVCHAVGGKSCVVTRRVTTPKADFVLVIHAGWVAADQHWLVDGGYRLYDDSATLEKLRTDPNAAFATVLERFGTRWNLGLGRVWWVPELRMQLPAGVSLRHEDLMSLVTAACGIGRTVESWAFGATVMVTDDHQLVIAGAHWIHADSYRAALIRASRSG